MKRFFGMFAVSSAVCLVVSIMSSCSANAAVDTSRVNYLAYASTNVTTSAYVTLVAAVPFNTSTVQLCDTSGKVIKIAQGSAGNEVDLFTVQVSGCVVLPYSIPKNARLSARAIDSTASTGYNTLSFFP